MNIQKGSIVYSKAGRDSGSVFMVLDTDGAYVFLADGDLRKIENPKRKNVKHLQPTNTVEAVGGTNAEIRKILAQYKPV